MTAAAMIVVMIPMAIGARRRTECTLLPEPRSGGLLFATPTTLLVVPYLFAMLRKGNGPLCSRRTRNGMGSHTPLSMLAAARAPSPATCGPTPRWLNQEAVVGARILAACVLVLLCGAVGIGFCNITGHAQVCTTAEQRRDFVPTVRATPVRASASTMTVTWPGTTEALSRPTLCSSERLHLEARCRHWQPG